MSKVVGHLSSMVSHVASSSILGRAIAFSFVILLAVACAVLLATIVGVLGAGHIHIAPIFLISSALLFLVFIERIFL